MPPGCCAATLSGTRAPLPSCAAVWPPRGEHQHAGVCSAGRAGAGGFDECQAEPAGQQQVGGCRQQGFASCRIHTGEGLGRCWGMLQSSGIGQGLDPASWGACRESRRFCGRRTGGAHAAPPRPCCWRAAGRHAGFLLLLLPFLSHQKGTMHPRHACSFRGCCRHESSPAPNHSRSPCRFEAEARALTTKLGELQSKASALRQVSIHATPAVPPATRSSCLLWPAAM